ncbi:hypothetical protein [Streptomyces sp. NBC_01530]|uniref:hypothetical protein n=1 Tax=Streptomyces sp. NBC_01530 TaxID=2903895 RepID=UPI00386AF595
MSTATPTQTPTPHLASLAAALDSGDRARVFAELSEEALMLCETAPSERLWRFWLDLSETFQHESRLHNQHAPSEVAS